MQLRDYQIKLKQDAFGAWRDGHRNVVLVSPTGSGKTVTMASIVSDLAPQPGVIIAHRVELVGQISTTLARFGIRHNVIGPSSTVKFCIQKHIRDVGRSYVDRRGAATVAAVDTLVARGDKLGQWPADQRWWMIDECFVAGTLVDGRPIQKVRVGDMVRAFDEQTGETRYRRVTRTFKRPMPDEMVLLATSHHSLYVTKGHPFWTKRGWVNAVDLRHDDCVFVHQLCEANCEQHGTSAAHVSQNGSHILHADVRVCAQGPEQKTARQNADCDVMSRLRGESGAFSKTDADVSKEGSSVLQQDMFAGIPFRYFLGNDVSNEFAFLVHPHDLEKSYALAGDTRKGQRNPARNWTFAAGQGWSWFGSDDCRIACVSSACSAGVRVAACGADRMGSGERDALHDRRGAPCVENSDRTGRVLASIVGPQAIGRAERRVSAWARVESVQVLKRDRAFIPGDDHVYNIEVDGLHTYFANDIVVHNCHHVLSDNKWGKAATMFPNAWGLGVTATPVRADRKSLHADQGGVFSAMVVGPTMRELIDRGALCDYRIFAPKNSIDVSSVPVGSTGDYSQPKLREAAHKSRIVGDIVESYLKIAPGKRGITFTVDVEQAIEVAEAYNRAGVPAMAVHAKTDDSIRDEAVRKLASGKLLQLVNVDLFGEGFDVPVVEVVSMGRPTMSYGLFVQQFGRALRPFEGKTHGIIIDHVSNVKQHGLPDAPRTWTLRAEERGKRLPKDPDEIAVKRCVECFNDYRAVSKACPFCGHVHEPAGRDRPEQVDGDLVELDPTVLKTMRGEVQRIDGDALVPANATPEVAGAIRKRWRERQEAQTELRDAIARWAWVWHSRGADDSEIYRRFWHLFGTDVMTAQTLGASEARELMEKISDVTV